MKDKIITVAKWAGAIIFVLFVVGLIEGMVFGRDSNPTDQSYETTAKNEFVSACTQNEGNTVQSCGCAWDALNTLYGTGWWHQPNDTTRNSDTINRIIQSGYNLTETDAMNGCWADPIQST